MQNRIDGLVKMTDREWFVENVQLIEKRQTEIEVYIYTCRKKGKIIICTRNFVRMYRLSDRRIYTREAEYEGKGAGLRAPVMSERLRPASF